MIHLESYKAGNLQKSDTGYEYFVPSAVNDSWTWQDPQLNSLLETAARRLGELNAFSKLVPNVDLYILLHVANEAVISSRIEGTKTQLDEALMDEEDISIERRDDWREVNNYIMSLNDAIAKLEQLPISSRLLRETHASLMKSVRGEHIPPHAEYVNAFMSDLEKFIHSDKIVVPDLIKIAIAHYQFETIHPFLDGNGRIGRLLITIF